MYSVIVLNEKKENEGIKYQIYYCLSYKINKDTKVF
jgi:hypothetical protein